MVKNVNAFQTIDTSNLFLKADYNSKIDKIETKIANHDHDKYINTQEFSFAVRLKEAKLATKDDFDDFVKKINFDKKLQRNKK